MAGEAATGIMPKLATAWKWTMPVMTLATLGASLGTGLAIHTLTAPVGAAAPGVAKALLLSGKSMFAGLPTGFDTAYHGIPGAIGPLSTTVKDVAGVFSAGSSWLATKTASMGALAPTPSIP